MCTPGNFCVSRGAQPQVENHFQKADSKKNAQLFNFYEIDPRGQFLKALMPVFFYWQENANEIVLAFKTPRFWQHILSNMLPI